MRQFIDPSIESNVFAVPSPTHKGSINGRRLVPQSFGALPLRLGARIRPTALRSLRPKPESETSLSSVVTSAEEVIRRIHLADTHRL